MPQGGQFVAVDAPLSTPVRDLIVAAALRRVGGPDGGTYGLIVRDDAPGARDGTNQAGRLGRQFTYGGAAAAWTASAVGAVHGDRGR